MKHKIFRTKIYNNESCVAYDLIEFIEKSCQNNDFIFWRVKPEIVKTIDFETGQITFRGKTRFTVI